MSSNEKIQDHPISQINSQNLCSFKLGKRNCIAVKKSSNISALYRDRMQQLQCTVPLFLKIMFTQTAKFTSKQGSFKSKILCPLLRLGNQHCQTTLKLSSCAVSFMKRLKNRPTRAVLLEQPYQTAILHRPGRIASWEI